MIYQNLPEAEIKMLISCYETKLWKIVQPLQRFETGLELSRYKDDNGLKQCSIVNFNNWMNDHNYRVSLGTPDTLTDEVYTRKFRNYMVSRRAKKYGSMVIGERLYTMDIRLYKS